MSTNHTTKRKWRIDSLRYAALYREPLPSNIPQLVITGDSTEMTDPWRICLVGDNNEALGLTLFGDAVLGRSQEDPRCNVDLSACRAAEKGVSRRHAMLRPTSSGIYLIDLGSTNGTLHNSIPVGPGLARSITDGDLIMLSSLSMTIIILKSPVSSTPSTSLDSIE